VAIEKPESPIGALLGEIRELFVSPARIINALPVFAAMLFFNKAMVELKPAIPEIKPFSWDETFMGLDRWLHFGHDPWVLLQPFMGFDLVTYAVNMAYNFWFVVLVACFFWQGFAGTDSPLRQRFLVSYFLTWLVGTCVLGTIFSSAGPCFYGFVVHGENPYAALMTYLHEANGVYPIWAVPTQDMLWQSNLAGHGEIEGVSAMPSMHVGIAVLLAILGFASGKRWLGWSLAGFAGVIFVGSILLGWHYAVDGYLGAATALFSERSEPAKIFEIKLYAGTPAAPIVFDRPRPIAPPISAPSRSVTSTARSRVSMSTIRTPSAAPAATLTDSMG
jgi:hypothetical protein